MERYQLGNSDLSISRIGFGSWAIGGENWDFGWGPQDDDLAVSAIHSALDKGLNWIDTAAVYGLGHSEELVAKALKGKRNEIIIATKCSLVWDKNGKIDSSLNAKSVRAECEASLRRLSTDYIDLYQIHWPNDDERIEEGWFEISRLIEEGKVRYAGVSNFLISHLKRAQSIMPITSLQPPYSMLRRFIEDAEMSYCKENNIGILAYSPMQSGLLTGKFDITKLADNDWRNNSAEFKSPNLEINLDFVDKLKDLAEEINCSVAQLAIAWVLKREEISAAIVGSRSSKQVEETIKSSEVKLQKRTIDKIETLLMDRLDQIKEKDGFLVQIER